MSTLRLNTYLNLCTQVYELSKPKPPQDAYAFYQSYAHQAKGPILEPMCGTGRFLLHLLEEGFDISGFDASRYMLDVLEQKACLQNLKPNVWQGFIEDFAKLKKYNMIFIPSGSFNLILELEKVKKMLANFYDCLNEDGVLIFEVITLNSASKQTGTWVTSVWPQKNNKMIIANFLDLPLKNNVETTLCKYELVEENQITHAEIEELNVRLYCHGDLMVTLKDIGFKSVRIVKAFNISQVPHKEDDVIIYECRK